MRNFRNYEELDMTFKSGINVLLGENGQGKTNLVESICIAARGLSFRPGSANNWLGNVNKLSGQIAARLDKRAGLSYEVKVNFEGKRKSHFIDNKRASRASLMKEFSCVLFSPESLSAIKGSPEMRRELIDDLLVSHLPGAADLIGQYERILLSRGRLLREVKKGWIKADSDFYRVLDSMEPRFIERATLLTSARIRALHEIQPELQAKMRMLFPRSPVDISVDYLISGESALNWERSRIETTFAESLKKLRVAEIESGGNLVGPQKHDIQFRYQGEDARFFCSQGQQRGLILSFKLAQIMYHYKVHQEYPVLLMDDVLSELDQERRTNLIGALTRLDSQILVTATDLSFSMNFGSSELSVYQVINGKIVEAS
ncbi:MAG: DNA replication and repair protein RecF [Bdellovibrionales bacterium]|nr:DNA replication and repair protein RecF [Bdellovibrionales bacterium]